MLSSISPFGERSRNSRWWLTVTAYMVGSVAGGATTGLAFGALGQLVLSQIDADIGLTVLAVAAVLGVGADLGVLGLRLPSIQRQVNEDWITTYRGWVYGVGFGYQLGLGLATIVTTSTLWLTWVAAAMTGSWMYGLALGALFGLARGMFIFTTIRIDDPAGLRTLFTRISRQASSVHQLAMVAAGLTAVTAFGGQLI
jgi:hypothetical protein